MLKTVLTVLVISRGTIISSLCIISGRASREEEKREVK